MDADELLASLLQLEDETLDSGIEYTHAEDLVKIASSICTIRLDYIDKIMLEKAMDEFNQNFGCDSDDFYKLWDVCMDILSRICHPLPDDPMID